MAGVRRHPTAVPRGPRATWVSRVGVFAGVMVVSLTTVEVLDRIWSGEVARLAQILEAATVREMELVGNNAQQAEY